MKLKYKIVFFGTPDFVTPILSTLEKNFEVVRSFRKPVDFNEELITQLKNLKPDFFVVASFGQILPGKILQIPKIAAINIHPSLLPKYRGPSPIQSQVLEGQIKTGVTFIKMDEGVDHGPIAATFEDEISNTDTFESLAKRLFKKSADSLTEVLNNYDENKLTQQDDSQATYTNLLTKESGKINLENVPANLLQMIRAYFPWPGVWTRFNLSNKEMVIKLLPNEKIQVEGKKPMTYKDFMNGYAADGKTLLKKLNLLK